MTEKSLDFILCDEAVMAARDELADRVTHEIRRRLHPGMLDGEAIGELLDTLVDAIDDALQTGYEEWRADYTHLI